MKSKPLLGLALAALVALPLLASKSTAHSDRFGFDVQIAPMAAGSNQYRATVVVKQLETGQVLFAPDLAAVSGTSANAEGEGQDGAHWRASFLVDGSTAKYTVEARASGRTLVSNSGSVQLVR